MKSLLKSINNVENELNRIKENLELYHTNIQIAKQSINEIATHKDLNDYQKLLMINQVVGDLDNDSYNNVINEIKNLYDELSSIKNGKTSTTKYYLYETKEKFRKFPGLVD